MALTVREACAVQSLLRHVLHDYHGGRGPDAAVVDEASLLADRAHRVLGAGLTGDEVAEAWESLALGPWPQEVPD